MFKNYFSYLFPKKDEQAIKRALSPLQNIHMDEVAKARTRALLQEYMAMQPVRLPENTAARTTIGHILLISRQVHLVPIMTVVLIFGLTAGTAFAAEGTLPGDLLYSVKVHVTEEIKTALTTNPKLQADWQIERTARRLEEASTLAVEGKFTSKNRVEIQSNLAEHVAMTEKNAKLLTENEDYRGAETVSAELHAVLKAHGDILASVLPKTDTENSEETTDHLVSDVIAHLNSVAKMSAHRETASTQDTDKNHTTATTDKQTAAQSEIASLQKYIKDRQDTAAPELLARANSKLSDAEELYATGVTELETGAATSARTHFTRARDIALDTKVALAVQTRLLTKTLRLAEETDKTQPLAKRTNAEDKARTMKTTSLRATSVATSTRDTEDIEDHSRKNTIHSVIGVLLHGSNPAESSDSKGITTTTIDTTRTLIQKNGEEKTRSIDATSEDQEEDEEIRLGL